MTLPVVQICHGLIIRKTFNISFPVFYLLKFETDEPQACRANQLPDLPK